MQIATFVVAVLGILMSGLSLGWQGATYLLTGRRVKVELLHGARQRAGPAMVTGPVSTDLGDLGQLAEQGFVEPIVAVRVRNVGRLPVTVNGWGLVGSPKGFTLSPTGMTIGEPLPHRLEAGESEIWAVDGEVMHRFAAASAAAFKILPSEISIRGKIELGDGRVHLTPEKLRPL